MAESGEITLDPANDPKARRRRPSVPARDGDSVDRILGAAEACFREAGYTGVSLREIAEKAGLSKSSVLYHFESKDHVFAELQLRVYRRLASTVTESVEHAGGAAADRARVALDSLISAVRQGNDLTVHAMLGARALTNPDDALHVRRMRRELRALLRGTLQEIFAVDGEPMPLELEAAGDLLWAALTGLGLQAVLDDSPEELERGFDSLRTVVALAFSSKEPAQ